MRVEPAMCLLRVEDQSGRRVARGKGFNGYPEYTKYLLLIFHEQTANPDYKGTGAGGSFRKLVVQNEEHSWLQI
ncbi:MAG: hypothetical protein KGO82_10950 [Bacteroidota bacterium]|nr:hypothetical protein [Bacteroidota bacterium]